MIKHNKHTIFEYNKITKYIYIGTNMCCQGHFNKELLNKGIRADLSLEEIRLDRPFGVGYYLWLPVKDYTAPSFKQLFIGINFLRSLKEQNIKCYVHCQNGHGRAPTLVAAYLISEGKSINEAINFLKKKRKGMHLNEKHIKSLHKFRKSKHYRFNI